MSTPSLTGLRLEFDKGWLDLDWSLTIIHMNRGGNLGTHNAPDKGQAQTQAQAEYQAEVVHDVVREVVPSYQDRIHSVRQTQQAKVDTLKTKTTQTDIERWSQTHENSKIGGEGTP